MVYRLPCVGFVLTLCALTISTESSGRDNTENVLPGGAANSQAVPPWATKLFPSLTTDVIGTGIPGLANGSAMMNSAPSVLGPDALRNTLRLDRHAAFRGGQEGFVVGALSAPCSVGPLVTTYEWCITSSLDNFAREGSNVAIYGQALKERAAGATWASVFEARDKSGTSDPVKGLLGSEIDVFATGSDKFKQRIGLNIVFGRADKRAEVAHIGHGLWFTPSNDDVAGAEIDTMIDGLGRVGTALDLSGFTISGSAVALGPQQKLSFDQDKTGRFARYLTYQNGYLRYLSPGRSAIAFGDDGLVKAAGFVGHLYTPPSSHAPCTPGQTADDANFHYVCVDHNKWKRVALTNF